MYKLFNMLFSTAILLVYCGERFETLRGSPATSSEVQPPQSALPKEITCSKDNSPMVLIPAGYFIYGINKKTRDSLLKSLSNAILPLFDLEFKKATKYLPSYYIDKYEVTNRQYAEFIKATGHRTPKFMFSPMFNDPDQPVVGVGWDDARAYAKWAGKRLPSEEEWEKAARGTDGRFWPWGNKATGQNYNGKARGIYAPVRVGSYPSGGSPYGAMDMAGNVYEMTTGTWGESEKAMRGGSFLNSGAYARTMFRWAPDDSVNGASWLGFRCVLDTSNVR